MAELRIGCLVMAAGSGSRFGRNKLEAVVDGKSLLRRSLEAVPAEEFAQVTVVTQRWQRNSASRWCGMTDRRTA